MASNGGYNELTLDVESIGLQEAPSSVPSRARSAPLWLALLLAGSALVVAGRKAISWTGEAPIGLDEEAEVQCFVGGEEEFELTLPYFENKKVQVPKLPADTKKYSYAAENALVSIPNKCYEQLKEKIKKNTTLTDRDATTGTAYFYIKDLDGGYDTLVETSDCSAGIVLQMHGSGGPGWSAVQFAALFSRAGYVQVIINSMSMPDDMGMKGKMPLKAIEDIDVSNYCGGYSAFDGSCSTFAKPFCYSTKVDNVIEDSTKYRKFVEGVYEIRKREMDFFVEEQSDMLAKFDKVFLVGNSEGAMAASRYHHEKLDKVLSGRILSAWSCNFNYFVSCPDSALICGDKCKKDVPQLNLIGSLDEYFGAEETSVSSKVAAADGGYGGPITGNCRATYDSQDFSDATVVVLEDAWHGPQYQNDNTWRSAIADFVAHAGKDVDTWKSLKGCKLEDGVYNCPKVGEKTCATVDTGTGRKYQVNPDADAAVAVSWSIRL